MLIPSKDDLRSDGHGDKIRFVSQAEVGNRQKYKYTIYNKWLRAEVWKKDTIQMGRGTKRKREGKSQVIKLGNKPIDIVVGPRPSLVPEVSPRLGIHIIIIQRWRPIVTREYTVIFYRSSRSFALSFVNGGNDGQRRMIHKKSSFQSINCVYNEKKLHVKSNGNQF